MTISIENCHEMINGAAFATPHLRAHNTMTTTKTKITKTKTTV